MKEEKQNKMSVAQIILENGTTYNYFNGITDAI